MAPLTSSTLKLGDRAPNFTLPDLDGRPFELADVIQGGSALLSFAPGVWSQTTRRQIDEFEGAHETLAELGVIPLIVVTQRAKDARRSLQAHLAGPDRKLMQPALSFPILADGDRNVARDYGIFRAFSLDGISVTRPAVFFIDPTGEIAFAYVGRNDADVPETTNLLHLVRGLAHPRLIPIAPELGMGPREVQGWDTHSLPRIAKNAGFPELAQPTVPISLPAARLDHPERGSEGTPPAEPAEVDISSSEPIALDAIASNGNLATAGVASSGAAEGHGTLVARGAAPFDVARESGVAATSDAIVLGPPETKDGREAPAPTAESGV